MRPRAAILSVRAVVGAALIGGVLIGALPPQLAFAADPSAEVVAADDFRPTTEREARVAARDRANVKITTPRRQHPDRARTAPDGRTVATAVEPAAVDPLEGVSAFELGNRIIQDDPIMATSAALSSRMVTATRTRIYFRSMPNAKVISSSSPASFFKVPDNEYYWTGKVYASLYRNRFIAVLPSSDAQAKDCANGHLNILVSRSSDPKGSWYRYRVTLPDAWTDEVNVGFSDTKVVFTHNEWNMSTGVSDCMGSGWKGARIKVADWADLLDGGSLTVRDVSPSPRTSYYSWMPIVTVPGTSSTSAGTTVKLVGERKGTTWGDVAYATVTGSAKSGSAKLATNVDLTTVRGLTKLAPPPETILAFPGGTHYLDQRIMSATARGSRLFLTSHEQCRTGADDTYRACARVTELNTSTATPTVVEDAVFVEEFKDTFLPFTGMARDGTVFFLMSRSSATTGETTDVYVTYRDAGESIVGGANEVMFHRGTELSDAYPGSSASVVPDPANTKRVWAQFGGTSTFDRLASYSARLQGNLTAAPAGTAVFGPGTGWASSAGQPITLTPEPTSPILFVRWSASPDTEDTGNGMRLVHGKQVESTNVVGTDFWDATIGGTCCGEFTVYVQWQTSDGRWSTPLAQPIQLDNVSPVFGNIHASLAKGPVGRAVPVRLAWDPATDSPSGVHHLTALASDTNSASPNYSATLGASATGWTTKAWDRSATIFTLSAYDMANNQGFAQPTYTPKVLDEFTSAFKYSSGWSKVSSSNYHEDSAKYATKAGAIAKFTFTGRAVGFVSTLGPKRGKAAIYVDGTQVATVDLYRSSNKYSQLVWETSWPTAGSHTIMVKVLGTSGRPRVDVDAFARF